MNYTLQTVQFKEPPVFRPIRPIEDCFIAVASYIPDSQSKGVVAYFDGTGVTAPPLETAAWVEAIVSAGYTLRYCMYPGISGYTGEYPTPFFSVGMEGYFNHQRWIRAGAMWVDLGLDHCVNTLGDTDIILVGQSYGANALAAYLGAAEAYSLTGLDVQTFALGALINGVGPSTVSASSDIRWRAFGAAISGVGPIVMGLQRTPIRTILSWGGADKNPPVEVTRGWIRSINSDKVHPYIPNASWPHSWMKTQHSETVRLLDILYENGPITGTTGYPVLSCAELDRGFVL